MVLAGAAPWPLLAQPEALHFTTLGTADGLPHSQVRALIQDRQGFMWFATAGGVARYDGYEIRVFKYDPNDPSSLASNNVWAVCQDRQGFLWFGTQGGLMRFDPATEVLRRFTHDPADPNSLPSSAIRSIYEDRAGRLWIGTYGSALSYFDPATEHFKTFYFDGDAPGQIGINGLYEAPSEPGILWVTTWGGGLGRFDTRTRRFRYYRHDPADAASLSSDRTISAFEDAEKRLWIGTEYGGLNLLERATGTFTRYRLNPRTRAPTPAETIWDITTLPGDESALWLGTDGAGLARFDLTTRTFAFYRHDPLDAHSIAHDRVKAFYRDASGLLWMATLGGGVSRTDGQPARFRHVTHNPDGGNTLSHTSVRSFYEQPDGILWIGTEGGGLSRFDARTGRFTAFRHDAANPSSIGADEVTALYPHREGLWVGLWNGGVGYLNPGTDTFSRLPGADAILDASDVGALYEDRQGVLWVGFYDQGLARYDPRTQSITHYRHDPANPASLSHNRALVLLEDRNGMLWVGTAGGGLNRFDRRTGTFTAFRHGPGDARSLSSNTVTALAEDRQGVLWVGTDGGLNRFDPSTHTFTRFTEQNSGLPDNSLCCLLPDSSGTLWMGSGDVVARLDPRTGTFDVFTEAAGLERQEFRVGYAGPGGAFYMGGQKGFDVFHPDRFTLQPGPPPPVVLTAMTVDGKPTRFGEAGSAQGTQPPSVELAPDARDVSFTFAALYYRDPARNRYRYKLEGYDNAWHGPTAERTATYTNLDPGTYTLRVQASNSDGVWNESGLSLAVHAAPFFYETPWFLALCGLGVVVLLAGSYRYRLRRLRRHEQQLEALVAARTDEVQQKNAQLEAQALRLLEMDHLKNRFFTNVSHEFRTPLTLTIGPLEDLHTMPGLPAPLPEKVDLALRNSRRLLRLINQLLDTARIEAGEMPLKTAPRDLGTFVRQTAQPFVPLAERRRVRFDIEVPEAPLTVYFDAEKLEQVVANVLSNAFKFTPECGAIRIAVAPGPEAARIVVRDNGPGIPPDRLPHLFERFYQSDEAGVSEQHGSGIGLALARDLTELHGGAIAAESTPGFGATFTITLPLGRRHLRDDQVAPAALPWPPPLPIAEDDGPATPEPAAAIPGADADRTTVLVVDDHPGIRAFVRAHLEQRYRVLEACDGNEALALARAALPDLVVSDVMMPGLDGFALVRALRADLETDFIPIVLLTARATGEDKIEGLETGADDYLSKPFSVRELQARVENLIRSRRRLRERLATPLRAMAAPDPDGMLPSDAAFLGELRAAVEAHLDDDSFSVERLAEAAGQSRSTLHRRLRDLLDLAPSDFVRRVRLEHAALLLAGQQGSVSEVAYAVGFKSVSHFTQTFRSAYGVLPSRFFDWQRQNEGGPAATKPEQAQRSFTT